VSRKYPDRYVMRSASSVIAFWVGAGVLLVVIAIPLVQANWRVLSFLLAPALLLAWMFWIVLYRPAVRYDPARAVVVNIGRSHVLPWGHVTNVHQGIGMIFDLDSRRPIQAVGVPAPRRPGIIAGSIDRRTRPTSDLHHEAEILDGVRRAALAASDPIESSWDVVPLVIGAVLVVAVVLEFLIGI
jgi:hypothetical protein